MSAYYNENDPFCVRFLRNLIKAGLIADGEVDSRSIEDVTPNDLRKFKQVHMFAGIGVWSYALRQAGWPDDRSVWTGSCPCQPFSKAGKGAGFADERHLWPAWFHLIQQFDPDGIFGEQVASDDGLNWLTLVHADLEGQGYSFAATDIPAAGFGAPHIRQRLYFAADRLVDTNLREFNPQPRIIRTSPSPTDDDWSNIIGARELDRTGADVRGLADAYSERLQGRVPRGAYQEREALYGSSGRYSSVSPTDFRRCDWVPCKDNKQRPIEPRTFPLVDGSAGRVGAVRAYGNALSASAAIGFIKAYLQAEPLRHEFGNLI